MVRNVSVTGIHVLTDTSLQSRYTHLELAVLAAQSGARVVQLRDKALSPAQLTVLATEIVCRLQQGEFGTTLVVNDHPTVAAGLPESWSGVHIGQEDGSPQQARNLVGAGRLLGVTIHSLAELEVLIQTQVPVDYIGVGPVFGTQSKPLALPPLTVKGLQALVQASPFPVVAIGGITRANVSEVVEAGVAGAALLSEFVCAPDPAQALDSILMKCPSDWRCI
jgi:thiamine-phosphate pyrophosphorylase